MTESHEVIEFELSKELKERLRGIFYDNEYNILNLYIKSESKSSPLKCNVDKSSMRNTLEQFDELVDGTLNQAVKLLCVYSIKYHLRKYIEFNDTEQKWYSENYPDDPSLVDKSKGKGQEERDTEDEKEKKKTKAEIFLDAAAENINKLFVDEYQEPHAAISVNGHLETIPIRSTRFKNWFSNIVYTDYEMVPDSQTLKDVIGILSAKAQFEDPNQEPITLNLRVAIDHTKESPVLYYDLTNKAWEFIEITSKGWKIVNNLILFHRYNNQQAQVYPSKDYPANILDKFVGLVLNETNVEQSKLTEYQIILKCYIICAFIQGFPKAIPMPSGSQGGAKSTLMDLVKMIIDPCIAKSFSCPRDVNELIQQLSHNYVTYYDNISELKDWASDELCRAVSGSGSSKRRLYTDEDDLIRSLKRCIGLNGINLAATKADILDRAIFFQLRRIADKDRRLMAKVEKEFEEMKPPLLGYILDILVKVLKWKEVHGDLDVSKFPRMADWAEHCEIISRCMGYEDGMFLRAYEENARIQIEQVIETSLVATCLAHFVNNDPRFNGDGSLAMAKDLEGNIWGWAGIASSLKGELDAIAPTLQIDTKSRGWPKNPSWLVKRLNEIMHTLRDAGIEIVYDQTNPLAKVIMIRKLPSLPSIASNDLNQARNEAQTLDGKIDGKTADSELPSKIHAQLDGKDAIDGNLHVNKLRLINTNTESVAPVEVFGANVEDSKYYKCPRCDYQDPNSNDVVEHMERIHK